MNTGITRTWE